MALAEKKLNVELVNSRPWDLSNEARKLDPMGGVPVLEEATEQGRFILAEPRAILEYLDERYRDESCLLSADPIERAEARWIMGWLERLYDRDVNQTLLWQRISQLCLRDGAPDSATMRRGASALLHYLRQIEALAGARAFLAGDNFSFADIAVAAHLSCLDYFGDIDWNRFHLVHEWYMRMKSRRSFRPLLEDRVPHVEPASHYAKLDD